jgi:hypothetical protein
MATAYENMRPRSNVSGKTKVVPVVIKDHAIKMYGGITVKLHASTSALERVHFPGSGPDRGRSPVPSGLEVGCGWNLSRDDNVRAENRTRYPLHR